MLVSYEKLNNLLMEKGETLHSLYKKGVISDHSSRKINNGKYVNIEHLAKICVYFNEPIESIVEVISKKDSDNLY